MEAQLYAAREPIVLRSPRMLREGPVAAACRISVGLQPDRRRDVPPRYTIMLVALKYILAVSMSSYFIFMAYLAAYRPRVRSDEYSEMIKLPFAVVYGSPLDSWALLGLLVGSVALIFIGAVIHEHQK